MSDSDLGLNGTDAPAGCTLAREIRRLRKVAGLSHVQLAAQIGYIAQTLNRQSPASTDIFAAAQNFIQTGPAGHAFTHRVGQ